MRRRDRYIGLVWLKRLPTDTPEGKVRGYAKDGPNATSTLDMLVRQFGLYCELGCCEEGYELICTPKPGPRPAKMPKVSASYKGAELPSVLAGAWSDYNRLVSMAERAELSPRQVVRWVA